MPIFYSNLTKGVRSLTHSDDNFGLKKTADLQNYIKTSNNFMIQ